MSEIIIIAAHCENNRVIGNKGLLPWTIPSDLRRFRKLTLSHSMIMGNTTFKCIGVLPGRNSLVISRTNSPGTYQTKSGLYYEVFNSIESALSKCQYEDKVYIIGGASVYQQTLNLCTRLELTIVHGSYTGDAFFPEYKDLVDNNFNLVEEESHLTHIYRTYLRK